MACFIRSMSAFMGSDAPGMCRSMVTPCCSASGAARLGDVFQQAAKVDFFQMEIAGAGEIDKSLHHAIEAADFAVDDVHVPAGIGLLLRQFVAQQLQVQARWH